MRTTTSLLLIGALVALAAIGVVAAQDASDSTSDAPSDVVDVSGHHCPLKDQADASSSSSSSTSSAAA